MESMEAAHVLTQSPDTGDRIARILTILGSAYLVVRIGVDLLPAKWCSRYRSPLPETFLILPVAQPVLTRFLA